MFCFFFYLEIVSRMSANSLNSFNAQNFTHWMFKPVGSTRTGAGSAFH